MATGEALPELPFARDADGSFVLDASRLARRFGWSAAELRDTLI